VTPEALYEQLYLEGFTFRADGDRLVVAPASRLTGRQQESIRANRDGLLALVRSGYDPARQRRIDRAMAEYEPDFSSGPVQLANLVLVDIFGRLVAVEAGEFEASLERLREHREQSTMGYCRAWRRPSTWPVRGRASRRPWGPAATWSRSRCAGRRRRARCGTSSSRTDGPCCWGWTPRPFCERAGGHQQYPPAA
jgi:hypothetical protein